MKCESNWSMSPLRKFDFKIYTLRQKKKLSQASLKLLILHSMPPYRMLEIVPKEAEN